MLRAAGRVGEWVESQKQNGLPWEPEPFLGHFRLESGCLWLSQVGSAHKTAVNFYNSPRKKKESPEESVSEWRNDYGGEARAWGLDIK